MTTEKQRLEENIAILDYDIKELTDIIQRYVKCKSQTLVDVAKELRDARQVIMCKRIDLIRKLNLIERQEQDEAYCLNLADYREVITA